MRSVFKFETAEQTAEFARLVGSDNFDLDRCVCRVEIDTMADHSMALFCYDAACLDEVAL